MKKVATTIIIAAATLFPTGVASADHEGSRCYEGECSEQEYDQWNSEQNNHNRRNRGAFSPGPFDDSPVDAFNNVCMPGATCYYDGKPGENQPPSEP